ncbi:MAG: alpha/beta hydrolase [Solimonas sp.]
MSEDVRIALLHGGGQGGWVWDETLAALRLQTGAHGTRDRLQTFALDVPGCGRKRGRDTTELGIDDIARELLDDLTDAGMDDVVLVGHSQAGSVLPRMAELAPQRIRHLVYVSCSIPLPGQTVLQMMGNGPHGSHTDEVGWPADPQTGEVRGRDPRPFRDDMRDGDTSAFLARLGDDRWPMRSYSETDWRTDHLGAIPASYLICLRDRMLPAAWQETFAARLKVRDRIYLDCGHQAMNARPQALAEILLRIAAP